MKTSQKNSGLFSACSESSPDIARGGPPNPRLLLTGAYARRSRAGIFCCGTRGCAARPGSRSASR
jgi:hypothetical protein